MTKLRAGHVGIDAKLTRHEARVAWYMINTAYTVQAIANKFFVLKSTVMFHRANMFRKLQLKSRTELMLAYYKGRFSKQLKDSIEVWSAEENE